MNSKDRTTIEQELNRDTDLNPIDGITNKKIIRENDKIKFQSTKGISNRTSESLKNTQTQRNSDITKQSTDSAAILPQKHDEGPSISNFVVVLNGQIESCEVTLNSLFYY